MSSLSVVTSPCSAATSRLTSTMSSLSTATSPLTSAMSSFSVATSSCSAATSRLTSTMSSLNVVTSPVSVPTSLFRFALSLLSVVTLPLSVFPSRSSASKPPCTMENPICMSDRSLPISLARSACSSARNLRKPSSMSSRTSRNAESRSPLVNRPSASSSPRARAMPSARCASMPTDLRRVAYLKVSITAAFMAIGSCASCTKRRILPTPLGLTCATSPMLGVRNG